jgi:hypothetical protein
MVIQCYVYRVIPDCQLLFSSGRVSFLHVQNFDRGKAYH